MTTRLFLPLCLLVFASGAVARPLVLIGATLIDGTGGPPIPHSVLRIEDGIITCAGVRGDCVLPREADTLDLSGYWIVPGLVDTHVHFAQTGFFDGRPDALDLRDALPYENVQAERREDPDLDAWLCSGVTGIFDVGGFPWSVSLARASRGNAAMPELAATGPLVSNAPRRMLNLPDADKMVLLQDERTVHEQVKAIRAMGTDAIKLWFLPEEASDRRQETDARVHALGEAAHAHNMPLFAHATGLREAKVALRAGATVLVHSVDDQVVDDEFIALMKRKRAFYVPTLIVSEGYWHAYRAVLGIAPFTFDDPNGCLREETVRRLSQAEERFADLPSVRAFAANAEPRLAAMRERLDRARRIMEENLRRVHAAGIPVALGTDAGNPGTLHGPAIHAELEAMQAAGLPPTDLLVIATRNGAGLMGYCETFGTLAAGKQANLLVLAADPHADIAALREMDGVMRLGRWVRQPAP